MAKFIIRRETSEGVRFVSISGNWVKDRKRAAEFKTEAWALWHCLGYATILPSTADRHEIAHARGTLEAVFPGAEIVSEDGEGTYPQKLGRV